MTSATKSRLAALAALAALVLLALVPLAARWLRRESPGRCALDGAAVVPLYRVRICDSVGEYRSFCCVRCAELWLARQSAPPQTIRVTDEASGQEIDAKAAVFVRSLVVTTPTTGNRIHAFASRAAAEQHADVASGRVLGGSKRPFCNPQ